MSTSNPSTLKALNDLLADYQVHYQKLRTYHWKVKGPLFFGLHAKFEEMYTGAAVVVDDLAERILALGGDPLGTLAGQLAAARLAEDATPGDAQAMVQSTVKDLEHLVGHLRSTSKAAADADDDGTANLLDGIADESEKTAWMLRAFLG